MTWSINISGHDDSPAGGSAWFSSTQSPTSKSSGTLTGELEVVAHKAVAFIRQCQAEEAQAHEAAPVEAVPEAAPAEPEGEASSSEGAEAAPAESESEASTWPEVPILPPYEE